MKTNETEEQKRIERRASRILSKNKESKVNIRKKSRKMRKKYDETVSGYLEAEIRDRKETKKEKKQVKKNKVRNKSLVVNKAPNNNPSSSELQKTCNRQRKIIKDLKADIKYLKSQLSNNNIDFFLWLIKIISGIK